METFIKIAIYWDMAMWAIGALVATGALVIAAMAVCQKLATGWLKKIFNDLRLSLWAYQALRAWEREGYPCPKSQLRDEREMLKVYARELIDFAEEHGYVLTIHTEPEPVLPLAMGNSYMVFDVRESRERYQQEASK